MEHTLRVLATPRDIWGFLEHKTNAEVSFHTHPCVNQKIQIKDTVLQFQMVDYYNRYLGVQSDAASIRNFKARCLPKNAA